MKKTLIFSFLILILAYQLGPAYAYTQSFQISVTIPAIPGVNVALETQDSLTSGLKTDETSEDLKKDNQPSEPRTPTFLERLEDKIIEANEIVYMVTLIER